LRDLDGERGPRGFALPIRLRSGQAHSLQESYRLLLKVDATQQCFESRDKRVSCDRSSFVPLDYGETMAAGVETRSVPTLSRCYPRSFTFYVANPIRSILPLEQPYKSGFDSETLSSMFLVPQHGTPNQVGVVLLSGSGLSRFGQTAMTGRVLPCTGAGTDDL